MHLLQRTPVHDVLCRVQYMKPEVEFDEILKKYEGVLMSP